MTTVTKTLSFQYSLTLATIPPLTRYLISLSLYHKTREQAQTLSPIYLRPECGCTASIPELQQRLVSSAKVRADSEPKVL
jgi:hypothetical protein